MLVDVSVLYVERKEEEVSLVSLRDAMCISCAIECECPFVSLNAACTYIWGQAAGHPTPMSRAGLAGHEGMRAARQMAPARSTGPGKDCVPLGI